MTLYHQVEDARKGDNRELMADDCYNAIVSAVNLIDEQLEKPRLQNARKLLEEVKTNLKTIRGGTMFIIWSGCKLVLILDKPNYTE